MLGDYDEDDDGRWLWLWWITVEWSGSGSAALALPAVRLHPASTTTIDEETMILQSTRQRCHPAGAKWRNTYSLLHHPYSFIGGRPGKGRRRKKTTNLLELCTVISLKIFQFSADSGRRPDEYCKFNVALYREHFTVIKRAVCHPWWSGLWTASFGDCNWCIGLPNRAEFFTGIGIFWLWIENLLSSLIGS